MFESVFNYHKRSDGFGVVQVMPKAGFKSITVTEDVYDRFEEKYEVNKKELKLAGINSFAGYVVSTLNFMIARDKVFSRFMPKIEKISVDTDRVILKDNIKNRIAEISVEISKNKKHLYCNLCNKESCWHVGFCYSLPEVYEIMGKNFG